MLHTVADLLEICKPVHSIPNNDPFMQVSLTLFEVKEYVDLICVLLLYSNKWIDQNQLLKKPIELGDYSYGQVKDFYDHLRMDVYNHLKSNSLNSLLLTSPRSKWVNVVQVTTFVSTMDAFKKLRNPTHYALMQKPHGADSHPAVNRFLINELIYNSDNLKRIPISYDDSQLIFELKQLKANYNYQALGMGLQLFPNHGLSQKSTLQSKTDFQVSFENLRKKIQSKDLLHILNMSDLDKIQLSYSINFLAIANFIRQYPITAPNNCPPAEVLQEFHEVVENTGLYEKMISELVTYKFFIDLEDIDTLWDQLETIENNQSKINDLIKTIPNGEISEEAKLQKSWFEIQLKTCSKYRELILDSIEEINQDTGYAKQI